MERVFPRSGPPSSNNLRRQFRGILLYLLQPDTGIRQWCLFPCEERAVRFFFLVLVMAGLQVTNVILDSNSLN